MGEKKSNLLSTGHLRMRKGGKRLEGMGVAHFVHGDRLNISTHSANMFWPTIAVKFHVLDIIFVYIMLQGSNRASLTMIYFS